MADKSFEERAKKASLGYAFSGRAQTDFSAGVNFGYREGAADRERELLQPMKCGHPKACEAVEQLNPGFDVTYCSACRREQALREALQTACELLKSCIASPHDAIVGFIGRAAALLKEGK